MPLSFFVGSRPLACAHVAQIGLDHSQHAGSGAFRLALDRRVDALRHACRMLARRIPSRFQAHCRYIAEHDTTRSPMLVSVLIHPGPFSRTESTQPKPAAACIPEKCLRLSRTTAHPREVGLGEGTGFPPHALSARKLDHLCGRKQCGSGHTCGTGWLL